MKKLILLLLLKTCVLINAQEKFIVSGFEPVVDPFTKEIYYYNATYPVPGENWYPVLKTNLTGDYVIPTEFPSVPVFANSEHKAVFYGKYMLNTSVGYEYNYEYNFETELVDTLFKKKYPPINIVWPKFYFPNDKNICFQSKVYNFEKDSIIILNEYPGFLGSRYFIYQANSDSTFLALLNKAQKIGEYHHLVEVNINTFVIDTLFSIQIKDNEYLELSAFAYNAKKQLLAISVYYDWENTLSIFDYSTDEKNLVYNTKLYETINGPSSIVMTEFMAWNEENDKLILVGNSVTGSWSAIDLFSLRDTSLNIISRVVDAPYGRLFEISWFDTTHIIYRDATYGGIYSHNIDIETSVKEEKNKVITDVLTLKNYPNPFNSFTNISFSLPAAGFINLVIYNLLGEKISEVSKDYFAAGTHTLSVDLAKVNSTLSSGIYIYTLKTSKQITSHKMVYLK